MSSYIIAGSADSIDTAYCEELARRIQAKYKNIDFRVVIKHPSEWEEYLQEICRIYGFLKKSNPIVYTFDGKIIGNRENFVKTATQYFGLDEELLIVENLTAKINMKLAQEEIKHKKIVKNNIKTLNQKIEAKLKELLQKKIVKYNLKTIKDYLVNGVEYRHRQLQGLCQTMKFIKNKEIPVIQEEIVPEDINLMALSLNDQIKPEETMIKEAFVTNANNAANSNEQKHPPSEADRMSEASKTNKLHQSIISMDKDSKGMKESNKTKLRIDEQNDDVPDYVDYPMKQTVVCELSDQFYIAFDPSSLIGEELIFYHNEDAKQNTLRQYNNSRPIKGHRVLIKEVHYQNQQFMEETVTKQQIAQEKIQNEGNTNKEVEGSRQQIEKSKTQPNIPPPEKDELSKRLMQEDAASQPHSDLNLISHMTYHTLFIHKPLSQLELKNLLYFVSQTDTIAALRFLPENPNPRVKLYTRKHLMREENAFCLLPIERFIDKQMQDGEFEWQQIPSEKGSLMMLSSEITETYKLMMIKDMGFTHYIYQFEQPIQEQKLAKIIKYSVDHILAIEQQVKRDIGYNLIFTKKMMMIVPIVQSYETYNGNKLYFDGLAYLGYVHTAKLKKPYSIDLPKVGNQEAGQELRKQLAFSSGFNDQL